MFYEPDSQPFQTNHRTAQHPTRGTHVRMDPKTTHFIYFGNVDTYCIFKTFHTIAVFCPQNSMHFIILSFTVHIIIMFYINGALKFKCPHSPPQLAQSKFKKLLYCVCVCVFQNCKRAGSYIQFYKIMSFITFTFNMREINYKCPKS